MRQSLQLMEVVQTEDFIVAAERCFVSAHVSLPLAQKDSPVRAKVWVEIEGRQMARTSDAFDERRSIRVQGTLACDIPGFPGTMNSKVTVQVNGPSERFQLTHCSDQRLNASSSLRLTHRELGNLYRRMWGRHHPYVDAPPEMRAAIKRFWSEFVGREVFYNAVEPPPFLAGIEPGLVGVVPPLDTGDVATVVTVGNSDVVQDSRSAEFICWARDPGQEFIGSFAEFAYWSRQAQRPPQPGDLVTEERGIPGTGSDEKNAWFICEPYWPDAPQLPATYAAGQTVQTLLAVPLTAEESRFYQLAGADALLEQLAACGAPFELDRPSCVISE
jgi:hypothetical protein